MNREILCWVCVIYFWVLGFSPHECPLLTKWNRHARSQRVVIKSYNSEALGNSAVHHERKSQIPNSIPVLRLVFGWQPNSLFQKPSSLWRFSETFQKSDQGYSKLHIKSQWVFVIQLVSIMPTLICTNSCSLFSFFFLYDSYKWCPTHHRSSTRKRGLSVRRNMWQVVKQGSSKGIK